MNPNAKWRQARRCLTTMSAPTWGLPVRLCVKSRHATGRESGQFLMGDRAGEDKAMKADGAAPSDARPEVSSYLPTRSVPALFALDPGATETETD